MNDCIKRLAMVGMMLGSGWLLAGDADNVIRLKQAGVSEDVMLAYIQNRDASESVSDDDIRRMEDANVPATVIVAMADGRAGTAASTEREPQNVSSDAQPRRETYSDENATDTYAPAADSTVVYAPPRENLNISFFYESLGSHGRWHKHASYGYVFQPAEVTVHADWHPYSTGGHWIWTNQGWYFESEYPWGWAAFHYGRWTRDASIGWVWVPGTEWAPAWVHWRQSDRYYGWAPLPPEAEFQSSVGFSFRNKNVGVSFNFELSDRDYAFVPCDQFLAVDLGRHRVPRREAPAVYNQTTIVNNTYVYNDNRVINNGVPVSQVTSRTRTTVETVQIDEVRADAGQAIRPERRNGKRINVYRPAIARSAPLDPNTAIRRRQGRVAARVEVQQQNRERRAQNQRRAQQRLAEIKSNRGSAASRQNTAVPSRKAEKVIQRQTLKVEQARERQEQLRQNREQARGQQQQQAREQRQQRQEQAREERVERQTERAERKAERKKDKKD